MASKKNIKTNSPSDALSPVSRALLGNKGKAVSRSQAMKAVFNIRREQLKRDNTNIEVNENSNNVQPPAKAAKTPLNNNNSKKMLATPNAMSLKQSTRYPFNSPTDNVLSPNSRTIISEKKKLVGLRYVGQGQDENAFAIKRNMNGNSEIKGKRSLFSKSKLTKTKSFSGIETGSLSQQDQEQQQQTPVMPLGNRDINI